MRARNVLEVWAGVECTWNRVGENYFDQLQQSGHRQRCAADLERFAALGLRTLRTALRWEEFASTQSWDAFDEVIANAKRLGIRPIVGLLHHGSGPPTTDLLDPAFPEKLAAYALEVARRYPDVLDYTPVNEPQTTGRFACLYGYWYPHHHTMQSYVRALFHQLKGIALSMSAIRSVQPAARLIHTEDAGETFSTAPLASFRTMREHRRWLGADLLCGRGDRDHALFGFLLENGLSEEEVLWFAENPCPPSVLGLNYYVTSDRFLDHRTGLYPWKPGGDTGGEPLIDVEAVRVRPEGIVGAGAILQQAWERYHLPLAITEAHLGCDPEEQCRWLAEIWRDAQKARRSGVDVRAVTVWALLGSHGWSDLCAGEAGRYEPGVFSLESGVPVPTALAELTFRLTHGLPVGESAETPGWWRRADRLTYPAAPRGEEPSATAAEDLHACSSV